MSDNKEVTIEVVNILETGECNYGHKIGDKFSYPEDRGKICAAAFHALYPYALGIRTGATYPWEEEDPDSITICCPDYKNPVVFKISRN